MKYGQQIERESVPEWSLHNIDYNSLKHHIKVHTTRDQASAISIPGHQDTALRKFEDELFLELCRQHDRVDLFVTSKANELSRRLQHLSDQIHKFLTRCATSSNRSSPRIQRRYQKYRRDLEQCNDDIDALNRFVKAQVVGFRKILKKYRKWTGSPTLGTRFQETVLSHPKSFTRRDFAYLQVQCDALHNTLRAVKPDPATADPASSTNIESEEGDQTAPSTGDLQEDRQTQLQLPEPAVPPQDYFEPQRYWNEYDNGSEAGDMDREGDGAYTIYIDPNDSAFPGWDTLSRLFRIPLDKTRQWFAHGYAETPGASSASNSNSHRDLNANSAITRREGAPLLIASSASSYGTTQTHLVPSSAYTSPTVNGSSYNISPSFRGASSLNTETDDDRPSIYDYHDQLSRSSRKLGSTWSDDIPFPAGYEPHYAAHLPSVEAQRIARYRERLLFYGTIGAFAAAFIFLMVAAVLMFTGRHRLRVEVDAGVTIGVCASLASGCAALGMNMNRQESGGWANWVLVIGAFATICLLNGGLLVMVVGNTAV
jgi:heme/copper-type cytochrome/quinol oxidase subunit 4